MAVAAQQGQAAHFQQLQPGAAGAPVQQRPRVHLKADRQFRQPFQRLPVAPAEAKPLRMHQHHLKAPIQCQHPHLFQLEIRPDGKGHFQHQRPGVFNAQHFQRLLAADARKKGSLGSRENPRCIRRHGAAQVGQRRRPPLAESLRRFLVGVKVRGGAHHVHALLRLPPKHLQRHGRILAAVIHIRKKVGVQVNDSGRFAAHPLSSSR